MGKKMGDAQHDMQAAAAIVRDAGGHVVGRTRLQKIAYLMELAGFGSGFNFEYRYYGPYSEDLAEGVRTAWAFDLINEIERPASWGGSYSIYEATAKIGRPDASPRAQFAQQAAGIDAIDLELAATAAYLRAELGYDDPWDETQRRKPDKATPERIVAAKSAYRRLRRLPAEHELPDI
jgi:uncharacterized protein